MERLRFFHREADYDVDCFNRRVQAGVHVLTLRTRRGTGEKEPYAETFTVPFKGSAARVKVVSPDAQTANITVTPHAEARKPAHYLLTIDTAELQSKAAEADAWAPVPDDAEGYQVCTELATVLFDCNEAAAQPPAAPGA